MPDPMTPFDLIVAAGLDPGHFATKAWAPQVDDKHPALVSGVLRANVFVVIRAWYQGGDQEHPYAHKGWIAAASVSLNPQLTLGELTPEEAERLRAESQTAQGLEAPVGQEAVIGRSDPKPYTPPVPPLDTAESVQADGVIEGTATEIEEETGGLGPLPESLGCGAECVRLKGPEGSQDYHGPDCTL